MLASRPVPDLRDLVLYLKPRVFRPPAHHGRQPLACQQTHNRQSGIECSNNYPLILICRASCIRGSILIYPMTNTLPRTDHMHGLTLIFTYFFYGFSASGKRPW
jgi:hypothetical protein